MNYCAKWLDTGVDTCVCFGERVTLTEPANGRYEPTTYKFNISHYTDARMKSVFEIENTEHWKVEEDAQNADFVRLLFFFEDFEADDEENIARVQEFLKSVCCFNRYFKESALVSYFIFEDKYILFPRLMVNWWQWRRLEERAREAGFVLARKWTNSFLTRGPVCVGRHSKKPTILMSRNNIMPSIFPSRAQIIDFRRKLAILRLQPLRLVPMRYTEFLQRERVLYASPHYVLHKDGLWCSRHGAVNILTGEVVSEDYNLCTFSEDVDAEPLPTYEINAPEVDRLLRILPLPQATGHISAPSLYGKGFYGQWWLTEEQYDGYRSISDARIVLNNRYFEWAPIRVTKKSARAKPLDHGRVQLAFEHFYTTFWTPLFITVGEEVPEIEYVGVSDEEWWVLPFLLLTCNQWELFRSALRDFSFNSHQFQFNALKSLPLLRYEPPRLPTVRVKAANPTAIGMEASVFDSACFRWPLSVLRRVFATTGHHVGQIHSGNCWFDHNHFVYHVPQWYVCFSISRYQNKYKVRRNDVDEVVDEITLDDEEDDEEHVQQLPAHTLDRSITYSTRALGSSGAMRWNYETNEYELYRRSNESRYTPRFPQAYPNVRILGADEEWEGERFDRRVVRLNTEENALWLTELKGDTGSGKTTCVYEKLEDWLGVSENNCAIYVTPRCSINHQAKRAMAGRFNYSISDWETIGGGNNYHARIHITTAHSLHKYTILDPQKRYLIILDEAVTIFNEDLLEVQVLKPAKFEPALAHLLPMPYVAQVMLVDANLDSLHTELVIHRVQNAVAHYLFEGDRTRAIRIFRYHATYSMVREQDRVVHMFKERSHMRQMVRAYLGEGKKVAIFCASLNELKTLRELYEQVVPAADIMELSSDKRPEDWGIIPIEIMRLQTRLLLYTTVASAGLDLSFPDNARYFDFIAVDGIGMTHLSLLQLYQACSRVRNCSTLLLDLEGLTIDSPFALVGKNAKWRAVWQKTPADFIADHLVSRVRFQRALTYAVEAIHDIELRRARFEGRDYEPDRNNDPFAINYALGSYCRCLHYSSRSTFFIALLLRVGYRCRMMDAPEEFDEEEYAAEENEAEVLSQMRRIFPPVTPPEHARRQALHFEYDAQKQHEMHIIHLNELKEEEKKKALKKRDDLGLPPLQLSADQQFHPINPLSTYQQAMITFVPPVEHYLQRLNTTAFMSLDVWHRLCAVKPDSAAEWERILTDIMRDYPSNDADLDLPAHSIAIDRLVFVGLFLYMSSAALGVNDFLPAWVSARPAPSTSLLCPRALGEGRVEVVDCDTWIDTMSELAADPRSPYYIKEKKSRKIKQATRVKPFDHYLELLYANFRFSYTVLNQHGIRFDSNCRTILHELHSTWMYLNYEELEEPPEVELLASCAAIYKRNLFDGLEPADAMRQDFPFDFQQIQNKKRKIDAVIGGREVGEEV